MKFLRPQQLSGAASDLVQFDADSIKQIARLDDLDFWVADPAKYERNGRVLRDSESYRMLAYSLKTRVLYATDGSNSCARKLPMEQLRSVHDIPEDLLDYLISLM